MLDQHDMVLLIGNLIENAFDALAQVVRHEKEIYVSMEQNEELLSILVEDNGCGMTIEVQSRVLERGFTTKGSDNRGIGLYLVGSIVDKGDGVLRIQSELGSGTAIELTFPMGGAGG